MSEDNISEVLDETFDQDVIEKNLPVLVDFWAEWCGPCKMIAPVLEEIATDYDGRLKIVRLNVDENQKTATKYNIRSIPTLLLFKDGNIQGQKIGAGNKTQLTNFIDEII